MTIQNKKTRDSRLATRNSPPRRGILLLVVLSLLTLFLMIGTAYLVTANQYRRAQKSYARAAEASQAPAKQGKLLDDVLNQLLRDTNNEYSSLRYHSLLRDVYGNDGFTGEVFRPTFDNSDPTFEDLAATFAGGKKSISTATVQGTTGAQIIEFAVYDTGGTADSEDPQDLFGNDIELRQIDGYYNGLVLTWTSGPGEGQSVRIVGYRYDTAAALGIFRVMAFTSEDGKPLEATKDTLADVNNRSPEIESLANGSTGANLGSSFVVNGRPFNGTGVGYNPGATTGARLNATEDVAGTPREIALMPNAVFLDRDNIDEQFYLTDEEITYLTTNPDGLTVDELEAYRQQRFASRGLSGQGGSDESYDAPDFQNMALAMLPVNPRETVILPGAPLPLGVPLPDLGSMILPSFHRPALLNYWDNQTALNEDTNQDLLRKVMLRPSWWDHPKFTGSNPDLSSLVSKFRSEMENNPTSAATKDASQALLDRAIFGPWDVDNDKDGIRDSVWVDFGAPVMKGPDGRLVKPMAALLVLDLDGRLNLNAHGTLDLAGVSTPVTAETLAGGTSSDTLPQGQGYGPADISLQPVVGNRFSALLNGATIDGRDWTGKYGGGNQPGQASTFDLIAQMKMQGVPQKADGTTPLGDYVTPPDFNGRYALGLNDFGQPVYEAINDSIKLNTDTPYELDLSLGASRGESENAADGPYLLAEMERLLRAYDIDSGTLPPRIWQLATFDADADGTLNTAEQDTMNQWRTLLTTDSYDMPVPNVVVPQWMVEDGPDGNSGTGDEFEAEMGKPPINVTFADLLEYRLRAGGVTTANIRREMSKLLAPDLADGLRLDINRAIGNGRDDNNNGVVDEPGEWDDTDNNGMYDGEDEAPFWTVDRSGVSPITGDMSAFEGKIFGVIRDDIKRDGNDANIANVDRGDTDNSGSVNTLEELVALHNYRRQLLARHLYVLAMTLVDPLPSTATTDDKQKRARRLAQWAINIIDFRDPDNCMTAFEYDADPFDGWAADGDMTTTNDTLNGSKLYGADSAIGGIGINADVGGVVWGAERPELLITETLAWHDRRTTDESSPVESSNFVNGVAEPAAYVTSPTNPDQDYDQLYRPRGAAFIEIYNPWPANPAANADTHAIGGTGKTNNDYTAEDYDNDGEFDSADKNNEDMGVHIAALDQQTGTSPVWRIAVYPRRAGTTPLECADWDPDAPDDDDRPDTKMDRCIYLAPMTGTPPSFTFSALDQINQDEETGDQVIEYYSTLPVPTVRPGRYLVVGSGEEQDGNGNKVTAGTTGIFAAEIGDLDPTKGGKIRRRIELNIHAAANPTSPTVPEPPVKYIEPNNTDDLPGSELAFEDPDDIKRATCDVAVITHAVVRDEVTGVLASRPRRFTLTEPAKGYPGDPGAPNPIDATYYDDPAGEGRYGNKATAAAYDIPFDDARTDGETRLVLPSGDTDQRIVECYSMVYLQRLANPLLPFNKDTNPYRTVDTMSANATVFNGTQGDPVNPGEKIRKQGNTQPTIYSNEYATQYFSSLQRGYAANRPNVVGAETNVFSYEPPSGQVASDSDVDLAPYGMQLAPKGGFVGRFVPTGHTVNVIPDFTLGAINTPFMSAADQNTRLMRDAATMATLDGLTPEKPFSWLTWNNRPFVSGNELLMVPTSRSSRLLQEFSGTLNTSDPYRDVEKAASGRTPEYLPLSKQGAFGHLPNMYLAEPAITATALPGAVPNLSRVLEYIHVPSRFVGTETWLNPTHFGQLVSKTKDARMNRQPPFNRISAYSDPGRVNLNTIADQRVYFGMMHGDTKPDTPPINVHPGPVWDTLVDSRRGYTGSSPLVLDADIPTFFANPFRSPDAGDLVPLDVSEMKRDGVQCTMLRQDEFSGATPKPPLFAAETTVDDPATATVDESLFRNSDRNAFFRDQPTMRLANLTTTRSNVYAVWVTIGFFEVEEFDDSDPADQAILARYNTNAGTLADARVDPLFNTVYPDGYMLGQEAGSETGALERIRQFAIFDRTIPVGFEPGKNHNVERAVRLKRRIE